MGIFLLPAIPYAATAVGGLLGGYGISKYLGSGVKKDTIIETETHAPYEHYSRQLEVIEAAPYQYYSPQLQYAPQSTYGYIGPTTIISSPEARVTKKQAITAESAPEQVGAWEFPISQSQEATREEKDIVGTDFTTITIIAAVGIVAYALVTTKKERKVRGVKRNFL